jgi:hypothetical protein
MRVCCCGVNSPRTQLVQQRNRGQYFALESLGIRPSLLETTSWFFKLYLLYLNSAVYNYIIMYLLFIQCRGFHIYVFKLSYTHRTLKSNQTIINFHHVLISNINIGLIIKNKAMFLFIISVFFFFYIMRFTLHNMEMVKNVINILLERAHQSMYHN